MASISFIPNQVFIGLPWRKIRAKYERAVDELIKTLPLSFVIVGRSRDQDARELLDVIKRSIDLSSYAVFDASQNNPNVSLEYGYAEAKGISKALYLCTHRGADSNRDHSIISDLAGKKRNHWTNERSLGLLLKRLAEDHPYTKRFNRFISSTFHLQRGAKLRARTLALKIIHQLDEKESIRKEDVTQELQVDSNHYQKREITSMSHKMHKTGLIVSGQGRHPVIVIN